MPSDINANVGGPTPRPSPPPRKDVIGRWEGEGGRAGPGAPEGCSPCEQKVEIPGDVDRLEEQIMSVESPEGQPPSKRLRDREWKIVGIVAVCVVIPGLVIVGVMTSLATVLMAIGLLFALVIAAFPVWTAALMRAREHRRARQEAQSLTTDVVVDTHAVEAAKAVSNKMSGPMTA
jgi:hypothetical protein